MIWQTQLAYNLRLRRIVLLYNNIDVPLVLFVCIRMQSSSRVLERSRQGGRTAPGGASYCRVRNHNNDSMMSMSIQIITVFTLSL